MTSFGYNRSQSGAIPCVNINTARFCRSRVSDVGQLPLPRSYPALVPRLCSVVRVGSLPCPVDRNPGPCRPAASFLPHERRSSKSECGRNAAGSDFTLPWYCLVLSVLSYSPRPPLLSAFSSSHALSPSPPFGLGPVRLCNVHHFSCLMVPCQLARLPSQPFLLCALTCTPTTWTLCTYCAVASCRLQEPYCWNHTTGVLGKCPAGRCVIRWIRADPLG